MNEYDERMILAIKNIESLMVAVNHFEKKRSEDAQRVELLLNTVAQQTSQISALIIQVGVMRAKLMGFGVTVE